MHPRPEAGVDNGTIQDLEWFALCWYRQTLAHICRSKGLHVKRRQRPGAAALARIPGLNSGHIVAFSPALSEPGFALAEPRVVGGPCIGDGCDFPTLEALYDATQALLVGQALGATVLLYVGDEEEALEHGSRARWLSCGARFEAWLTALAATLGVGRVVVVRTSSEAHRAALRPALAALADLPAEAIDGAFHLAAEAAATGNERTREVAKRVIGAHIPYVVAAHAGCPGDVIVVENLQQAGVLALAAGFAQPARLLYIGHWPAPSLSGGARMYRAAAEDKLAAWDLEALVAGEIPVAHEYTRDFFASWLTPALRATLARVARDAWQR